VTCDVWLFAQASHIRITLVGIPCGGGGSDSDTQLIKDNVHEWLDVSDGEVNVLIGAGGGGGGGGGDDDNDDDKCCCHSAHTAPLLHHPLTQPSSASDSSAAATICALTPPLHIAIDIDGFTSAARPAIFAHKCLPLTTPHAKHSIPAVKF
jgi:hypothetical protein